MLHQPVPRYYLVTFAFAFTLLCILLGVALTPASLRPVSPILLFAAIYAWALFSSRALPLASVFILALISDVLMGLPLGCTPLAALLLSWLVDRGEKRIKRNFLSIWLHFFLHLAITFAALILLLSLYRWQWADWHPLLVQALFTFLCYPPMQWVFVAFLKQLRMFDHG